MPLVLSKASNNILSSATKTIPVTILFLSLLSATSYGHADNMSALISQKSAQLELAVPAARVTNRSTVRQAAISPSTPPSTAVYNNEASYNSSANYSNNTNYNNNANYSNNTSPTPVVTYRYPQPTVSPTSVRSTMTTPVATNNYRYPVVQRQTSTVLPAFLSGSYDNVDSEYLPLLSSAELQSSRAAREVISTARAMTLNERMIIQGGCWDYLNAVFNRAGVNRNTLHKGTYEQGPYANSSEIEIGDWLYYINHGYNGVEHSGLFVGWVDESAKQALILSYAGESRREPARYRVYDLSNVYQIMRPMA